ncbi:MAG: MFS transporter [Candidatus Methanomethylicaceae archaeon]
MNRHTTMALFSCAVVGMVFLKIPPVLPRFQDLYFLSSAQAAFLVTSVTISHALVQIPAGMVTDRLGSRKALICSLLLICVSSILPVAGPSPSLLIISGLLSGTGTGFAFNSGIKYATLHSSDRFRGLVQGSFGGAFSLGGIPAYLIVPVLFDFEPKLIFAITSAVALIPALGLIIWGKDVEYKSRVTLEGLKIVFYIPSVWMIGVLHAIFFGSFMTLATWFPAFAVSFAGVDSLNQAGAWGSLLLMGSGIARITGGAFVNWISSERILWYALLFQAISMAVLICSSVSFVTVISFGTALYMSSVTFGAIFNLCYNMVGESHAGTGFGLLNFIANIGSSIFPVIFGWLVDMTCEYTTSFFFMIGLCCVGGLCLFFLKKEEKRS